MNPAIKKIIDATVGSIYENHLYLVGGVIRDKVMGRHPADDIDIVYEGDALALTEYLYNKGITDHTPVVYPRFGTSMVSINGKPIEFVSARKESYSTDSRKPDVEHSSLYDDIYRRDFTINTLVENLHTGEMLDLTAMGLNDIRDGIIRTPKDPNVTFYDDPLRMLRAIRFSVKYKFMIEEKTYDALTRNADRLDIISKERIRDEFVKIILVDKPSQGLKLMKGCGLLDRFIPELLDTIGVFQSGGHVWDVWDHTMHVLDSLPHGADLVLRLAALFHDIAKPMTKTNDKKGQIHFYGHEDLGGKMVRRILARLRFPRVEIMRVAKLVEMHIRIGEYSGEWKDSAVRRLMHVAGRDTSDLLALAIADRKGSGPNSSIDELLHLERRMEGVLMHLPIYRLVSPLDGDEIMKITGLDPGPAIKKAKKFLVDEIIEGRLMPGDKIRAEELIKDKIYM